MTRETKAEIFYTSSSHFATRLASNPNSTLPQSRAEVQRRTLMTTSTVLSLCMPAEMLIKPRSGHLPSAA